MGFTFQFQDAATILNNFSSDGYNSSKIIYRWDRKPTVQRKFMDQFLVTGEETTTYVAKYVLGEHFSNHLLLQVPTFLLSSRTI